MPRVGIKDFVGGLLIAGFGLFVLLESLTYPMGTASRMGPGYFPALLGGLAIALGFSVAVSGLFRPGEAPRIAWRPMLAVLGSILAFVLALRPLGLAAAVVLTVAVSSLGDRGAKPLGILVLAVSCTISAWLLFRVGLGLPIPLFPAWL